MENSRKNNDCYFYYYSTCRKGDGCTFRHEPAARGSETVCSFWVQGKCGNTSCNFRHMELKKNRKTIPCYWESQPSGCRKAHCPFQHKGSRDAALPDSDNSNDCDGVAAAKPQERPDYRSHRPTASDGREGSDDGSRRGAQEFAPVDPLVVRFEEESDSESALPPQHSPRKPSRAATQEELHLLRIQAEAAAFYSYDEIDPPAVPSPPATDFRVLSLAEIRQAVKRAAVTAEFDNPKRRRSGDGADALPCDDVKQMLSEESALSRAAKRGRDSIVAEKVRRVHSPVRFQEAEPSIGPSSRAVRLRRPAHSAPLRLRRGAEGQGDPAEIAPARDSLHSQTQQDCETVARARESVAARTEHRTSNGNGAEREEAEVGGSDDMAAEELLLGNATMHGEEIADEDIDALLGD